MHVSQVLTILLIDISCTSGLVKKKKLKYIKMHKTSHLIFKKYQVQKKSSYSDNFKSASYNLKQKIK